MWVFRLPTKKGGDPVGRGCSPDELNASEMTVGIANSDQQCQVGYNNDLGFILDELFTYKNLRQGWGIPTLDLRLPEDVWIAKYILAAKKYWNEEIGCDSARGRRNIIGRMLSMRRNDIIFLPKISKEGVSSGTFSIATVQDQYFFEDRSQDQMKDFAHIIKVKNVKSYSYPNGNIDNAIFGAPFMSAVESVEPEYANNVHEKLLDFVKTNYL
jgi:hypothetical protein